MPLLSDDDAVRLDRSKYSNKNKKLSVGIAVKLENMPVAERAAVLTYALTPKQQRQVDEFLDATSELNEHWKIMSEVINNFHEQLKISGLDLEQQTLYLKGKKIDLDRKHKPQGLLAALLSDEEHLTTKTSFKDFLSDNKDLLNSYGITSVGQIRSIKNQINKLIPDFFPYQNYITINPKYLPFKRA